MNIYTAVYNNNIIPWLPCCMPKYYYCSAEPRANVKIHSEIRPLTLLLNFSRCLFPSSSGVLNSSGESILLIRNWKDRANERETFLKKKNSLLSDFAFVFFSPEEFPLGSSSSARSHQPPLTPSTGCRERLCHYGSTGYPRLDRPGGPLGG